MVKGKSLIADMTRFRRFCGGFFFDDHHSCRAVNAIPNIAKINLDVVALVKPNHFRAVHTVSPLSVGLSTTSAPLRGNTFHQFALAPEHRFCPDFFAAVGEIGFHRIDQNFLPVDSHVVMPNLKLRALSPPHGITSELLLFRSQAWTAQ
jgi:hypothetical protein